MTTTIEKVRNYQGTNSFVIKMKESLTRWGSLTPKQIQAVEKCLLTPVTTIEVDELPDDLKVIANYQGENKFVKDIQSKLHTYGSITDRQKFTAIQQIDKEKSKAKIDLNLDLTNETIKIGRKVGQELKEKYNLEFNPVLIDITRVLSVTPKAVQFAGKLTIKRGRVCLCCMKTLTDEFSMLTNLGKICAKKLGVEYITDKSQTDEFRRKYLKRVEEIGEMEFWVPKSQIKKWDGDSEEPVMDWITF